jgi:hypothetical protein
MGGFAVPSREPSSAAESAATHLDSALEMICAALVALDTDSVSPARALDANGAQALAAQAREYLRVAVTELRLMRNEGPNRLVPGFVLQSGE